MSCYVPTNKYTQVVPAVAEIAKKVNKVPSLEKQMPNRVGNQSLKPANNFSGKQHTGGVTNVPPYGIKVSQPKGNQGAPKATGKINYSNLSAGDSGNKANAKPVDRPKSNYGPNDSYRSSSFLK